MTENKNYELQEILNKKEAIIGFLLRINEIDRMKHSRLRDRKEIANELKEIKEIVNYYLKYKSIDGYLLANQYNYTNYQQYDEKLKSEL